MKARDPRLPAAGVFLTRDFKGANVLVQVLEDHFIYDGSSYGSLSKVASVITGKASINGYAFFGLTDTQQREPKRKTAADRPVLDYPKGLDFNVKDRVHLTTLYGKVHGIVSWYTTGRGYNILTCKGDRNSDVDNLELVKGDRSEHEILENITECYDGLSGERLTCDGEASAAHIRTQKCSLNRMLIYLFGELGRKVTEDEAYEWASVHSKVNAAVDAAMDAPR